MCFNLPHACIKPSLSRKGVNCNNLSRLSSSFPRSRYLMLSEKVLCCDCHNRWRRASSLLLMTGRFWKILTAFITVSVRRISLFQLEKPLVSITVFEVSLPKTFVAVNCWTLWKFGTGFSKRNFGADSHFSFKSVKVSPLVP